MEDKTRIKNHNRQQMFYGLRRIRMRYKQTKRRKE